MQSAVMATTSWHFSLQPPGDTLVRRGFVDSLLCGCIPVVAHNSTADYPWFVPRELYVYAASLCEALHQISLLDAQADRVREQIV